MKYSRRLTQILIRLILAIPLCFLGIMPRLWAPLFWPVLILGVAILTGLQVRHHLIDRRIYRTKINAWAWKAILWVAGNGLFIPLYWIVVNGRG